MKQSRKKKKHQHRAQEKEGWAPLPDNGGWIRAGQAGEFPPFPEDLGDEPEYKAREARELEYGHLEPEDIIENQKRELAKFAVELEQLQKEKRQLEEELRIARSDRRDLETAITNYFVNNWRAGR